MTEPLVSSALFDLLVIALIVGPPAALGLFAWLEHLIARRAEEQHTDRLMRRGFKAVARRGWLRDDVQ
jgi:hypothetical protein